MQQAKTERNPRMPYHKNQMIEIKIDSLSSDGNGVGRHESKVIFVPLTVPGDLVRVKIVKDTKTHAFARIEQVVTPGPGRVESDCPAFRVCGGCCFRQMTYETELAAKEGFVRDALQRLGALDVPVMPILSSPKVDRYRNKAQYPLAPDRDGNLIYGFFASRSHRIVQNSDCMLQTVKLNQVAGRLAELLIENNVTPYDEVNRKGLARHICLREGGHSGEISVCIVTTNGALPQRETIATKITEEFPEIKSFTININPENTNVIFGNKSINIIGDGTINDTLCDVPLHLNPPAFSQVNTPGAEQLFRVTREYANINKSDLLLDLYCGSGVIGLSMAAGCDSLIGVEVHGHAIENARRSAAEMGLLNTRFIQGDAGAAASKLAAEGLRPDIIILDPPRKGCDNATLDALLTMSPRRVVMVSCNPSTLARDLAFLGKNGYATQKVQPVDMFPRTRHVEAVALVEKT